MRHGILFSALILAKLSVCGSESMVWPTPHPGPALGAPFQEWIQPTVTGDPVSGLFGCVRTDGQRFHEALDIAPFEPRFKGEATDAIYAAWAGTVVHVNTSVKDSGYGRYVVIEHRQFDPAFVTLYAHLAKIGKDIRPGTAIRAGDVLGTMGRSAGGYSIPKSRAHLHFEIGLRLSDDFQRWYDGQKFGSVNEHGVWNGMNLIGLDPLAAYEWMKVDPQSRSIPAFIETLPTAFIFEIYIRTVPDFVRRYPSFLTAPLPAAGIGGWRVAVTGWGMPLRFTPLPLEENANGTLGLVRVVAVDPDELAKWNCRDLIRYHNGVADLEVRGLRLLQLLFSLDLSR